MQDHLFSEFEKVSSKAWKQKIQADLKGLDYQTLITKTLENIDIKPFYHYDDYTGFEQWAPASFSIGQSLQIYNESVANKIARKALIKGGEIFIFKFDKAFEINRLIDGLKPSRLVFKADMLNVDFLKKLYQQTEGKSPILIDPIGHFARYGNWYENERQDFDKLNQLKQYFDKDFRFLDVNAHHYKNAGANITQELAYSLSHAVEYIEKLGADVIEQIQFSMATGAHYFFEIAKIKALHQLWLLITGAYNRSSAAFVYSEPAMRNKTVFDPYVNMLRTGMEMMSAILGGSQIVANLSFDAVYKKSNEFSERIARNQLIILKKEAGFASALNATEGNYFVEENTYKIAQKSLDIFKDIEASGGFLSQLYKGKIQQKIEESAQKEQAAFDSQKLVLVGTNKYENTSEDNIKIDIYPFIKKRSGQTLIQPVIPKRLAETIEKDRLQKLGISF